MNLQADSTSMQNVASTPSAPIPRRSRTKVLEVVPDMTAKLDPATGKPVMVRNRSTRRLEPVMVPTGRWRLNGYYLAGKRVRRFYKDEASALDDLQKLQTAQGNVDAKTRHALANRNDLVQDAIRAVAMLPAKQTLLEGVREYTECLTSLEPYKANLREVVAEFVKAEQARRKSITIGDLVKTFVADRKRTGASHFYLVDMQSRLNRFEEWFGSNIMASDVTAASLVEWLGTLDVSGRTKNNSLRVVGVMFSFAVKRGFIAKNPCRAVDKIKVKSVPPAIFTPKKMTTLLEKADAKLLPFLAIGAFAGVRPEEMRRLRWQHLDFDAGLIEVEARHSKTAQRRLVTMSDNLKAWLAPWRKAKGKVVPDGDRELREAAMVAAKIKTWPVDVLRHSFASYHLAMHDNAAKTALEMGHSTTAMLFEHYRNLVKPEVAKAWWAILPAQPAGDVVVNFAKESAAA